MKNRIIFTIVNKVNDNRYSRLYLYRVRVGREEYKSQKQLIYSLVNLYIHQGKITQESENEIERQTECE